MEKLNEVAEFLERNPGLADCVVQITYSEMHDIAEAFRELERRAEAAEAKLAQREKLDEEAMHCATILEFIGSFESDDIDGDLVDLRFEIDGEDTGSDVSITEYALRSAKAIRAIISGASVLRPAPAINLAELVPDGFVMVPRALTAENGAKAALLGEFNLEYNLECHECFGEGCDDCSGEGRWINSIPVDWTTIKEIWAKGIEHFQAAAPEVE